MSLDLLHISRNYFKKLSKSVGPNSFTNKIDKIKIDEIILSILLTTFKDKIKAQNMSTVIIGLSF